MHPQVVLHLRSLITAPRATVRVASVKALSFGVWRALASQCCGLRRDAFAVVLRPFSPEEKREFRR